MLDITIDTQILMAGSGKSDPKIPESRELLIAVMKHDSLHMAVDSNGKIQSEYHRKLGSDPGCLGVKMLERLAKNNRIVKYTCDNDKWKPVRLALKKCRFHRDDHIFVKTAMASKNKRLVAEEKGYTKNICRIMRSKAHVSVMTAADACFQVQ